MSEVYFGMQVALGHSIRMLRKRGKIFIGREANISVYQYKNPNAITTKLKIPQGEKFQTATNTSNFPEAQGSETKLQRDLQLELVHLEKPVNIIPLLHSTQPAVTLDTGYRGGGTKVKTGDNIASLALRFVVRHILASSNRYSTHLEFYLVCSNTLVLRVIASFEGNSRFQAAVGFSYHKHVFI
ncbi:hypothetical protein L218DRAFT_949010 [Marasmius fiardii PR-910]|nr:hypothetical protein L218DRAFT_949010 [Marasmius fiardii PR-910]